MLSTHEKKKKKKKKKRIAPDISRITEMFPLSKPGYTALLRINTKEIEKRCI